MGTIPGSIPDVCDLAVVRGAAAKSPPDLLLEVPHGATTAAHFDRLRAALRGDYRRDLREFYFVNTDVGAPELALAIARAYVAARPASAAVVLRSLIPRTFVDCNRDIDPAAAPRATKAGEMTPGLPAWVRELADKELLLAHYTAYRDVATAAFAQVCGAGGRALMVHTYAPRSVDVPVDDRIVEHLRAAYAPDRLPTWPQRAEVDLITNDPDGKMLASPALADAVQQRCERAGLQVVRNGAYALHPVTLAHRLATAYPQRTLCFELRRDLLVPAFTPFVELSVDSAKVERAAAPFAAALAATA